MSSQTYTSLHCSLAASSATRMSYSSAAYFSQSEISWSVSTSWKNMTRYVSHLTSDGKTSHDTISHLVSSYRFSLTLITENGSFCSWSRYFSMLKNVSKKIWDNLHLLRSRRVILPGWDEIGTCCKKSCIFSDPRFCLEFSWISEIKCKITNSWNRLIWHFHSF